MSNESSQPLPPNGRLISAGMAAAAAIGLLINHFVIEFQSVGKLMILCVGPIALFLGIGGMVEPKIVWSVGKYGKHLPVIYKLIGGALGALGVAVTLLLLLFVYRLGPPEPQPTPRLPKRAATAATSNSNSNQPITSSKPERHVVPQEVLQLTYDRPKKRWVQMDDVALQGVRREDTDGVTTLHYAEGDHALLKVAACAAVLASCCFTNADDERPAKNSDNKPDSPALDGQRPKADHAEATGCGLQISLKVAQTTWKYGDKIDLVCTYRNVSSDPIRVPSWGTASEFVKSGEEMLGLTSGDLDERGESGEATCEPNSSQSKSTHNLATSRPLM